MKKTTTMIQREERAKAVTSQQSRHGGLETTGPDHARHQARQQVIQGYRASLSMPLQREEENKTGLPDSLKSGMEDALGADFSAVRVHASSSKAPAEGALAYTQGSEVHFAPGQFSPDNTAGRQLIGHELAHVVQQREGRVAPTTEVAGMPVNDNPALEAEADVAGHRAASLTGGSTETAQRARRDQDTEIVQRASMPEEEEELMQGKFAAQLKMEDEEEMMKP